MLGLNSEWMQAGEIHLLVETGEIVRILHIRGTWAWVKILTTNEIIFRNLDTQIAM